MENENEEILEGEELYERGPSIQQIKSDTTGKFQQHTTEPDAADSETDKTENEGDAQK